DEEYTKDYHPIIKLDWEFPLIGYWGRGIAELLTGTQIEINHILRVIQKGHRGLVPRFMVEKGAEVSPTHLNDEVWSIVKYTLNRPDIVKGEA
ncbi:MAG: hypothetical protein GTN93_02715, partial [Anaerolineae bacterium]|nr:hypothetical protein [Anaerolineae bacterium]NIQ77015.1 hypothetical protein [Anaerolineae bacterium]